MLLTPPPWRTAARPTFRHAPFDTSPMLTSTNPATGESVARYDAHTAAEVSRRLDRAAEAAAAWAATPLADRTDALRHLARVLARRKDALAQTATVEMGKPIGQAVAEVEKCARVCRFYATHAPRWLRETPARLDRRRHPGARSSVVLEPLGVLLAVMPWNFPYWQFARVLAPALALGNVVVLKHAANVTGCALALEDAAREAGLPDGVFQALLVGSDAVAGLIADDRVAAVTLTGSEGAGRAVGEAAGRAIKPVVLELGGSDAFVVLRDADLDAVVPKAVAARVQNNGQSCIAAKRFVVERPLYDAFVECLGDAVAALRVGDPLDPATDVGPLARRDLRDDLHRQVTASVDAGARRVTGGVPVDGPGAFYAPTVLADVAPGMAAWDEETFGPVAAVCPADDADDAVRLANATRFGLGGSVWTRDVAAGEAVARRLRCGSAFVNAVVASDPAVPFGGVGVSGVGRELGVEGLRSFAHVRTLWVGA